jgi:hypothetical protein
MDEKRLQGLLAKQKEFGAKLRQAEEQDDDDGAMMAQDALVAIQNAISSLMHEQPLPNLEPSSDEPEDRSPSGRRPEVFVPQAQTPDGLPRIPQRLRSKLGELASDFLDDYGEQIFIKYLDSFKEFLGTSLTLEDTELLEVLREEIGNRGVVGLEPHFPEWRQFFLGAVAQGVSNFFAKPPVPPTPGVVPPAASMVDPQEPEEGEEELPPEDEADEDQDLEEPTDAPTAPTAQVEDLEPQLVPDIKITSSPGRVSFTIREPNP